MSPPVMVVVAAELAEVISFMFLLSSESSDARAKPLPTSSILSYHDLGLPEIMKSIVKKSLVTIFGNCSLYLKQRKTLGPKNCYYYTYRVLGCDEVFPATIHTQKNTIFEKHYLLNHMNISSINLCNGFRGYVTKRVKSKFNHLTRTFRTIQMGMFVQYTTHHDIQNSTRWETEYDFNWNFILNTECIAGTSFSFLYIPLHRLWI